GTADTITRVGGSWLTDGFRPGQTITVNKGGSLNNGTFTIDSVNALVITLSAADSLTNEGPANSYTVTGPDTITRAAGSWITDGFAAGGSITVSKGGSSNNGTFTVGSVEATVLTLDPTDSLNDEGPAGSYTVTGSDSITRAAGSWISDG